jgi:hypothetical protein
MRRQANTRSRSGSSFSGRRLPTAQRLLGQEVQRQHHLQRGGAQRLGLHRHQAVGAQELDLRRSVPRTHAARRACDRSRQHVLGPQVDGDIAARRRHGPPGCGAGRSAARPPSAVRRQGVDAADEVGHEGAGRLAVHLQRRAHLLDAPWFITTMRSATLSASSWSCVTMMVVTPSCAAGCGSPGAGAPARWRPAPTAARPAAAARRGGQRTRQRDALLLAAGQLAGYLPRCPAGRPA